MPVKKLPAPELEGLKAEFSYDADTGELFRKSKARICRARSVSFRGVEYRKSKLCWYLHTGEWPDELDHKDTDDLNDKIANLRPCSHAQNLRNRRMPKHNKLGVKGVQRHQGGYRARIRVNGVIRRGEFSTIAEAAAAYRNWSSELHGEFGRV